MAVAEEQVRTRLAQLRHESQLGESRLREVLAQEAALRETLLRISGAIQVLEEVLAEGPDTADTGTTPSPVTGDGARPGSPVLTVP